LWSAAVWESADLDESKRRAAGVRPGEFYARYSNPTVRAFEEAIAELEGAEDALAFGSGMGAISSVLLALCSSGDHVVASRQLYAGTSAFLSGPLARFGVETTFVDGADAEAIAAAVIPGRTTVVLVESPSNPLLGVTDLAALGSITGPFTVVDATFATPLGQRTLDFGVDLVVHSATKGISGHNDVTLGVIAGERDLIEAVWAYSVLHGSVASPADAQAAVRGLRTLDVRLTRQSATSLGLARHLEEHPSVAAVHHLGLDSHPQAALVRSQMLSTGSMLSFEVAGGLEAARRVHDGVALVRRATSLGGTETLLCHPASTTHVSLSEDDRRAIGVTDGLLRVSVGLEDVDDLWGDLSPLL
jgi:cystathionine beta-lyase/cystathionine gamma-synthase